MNSIVHVTVGVDVGKKELVVCVYPTDKRITVQNNRKGIDSLFAKLRPCPVQMMVCEASGGFECLLKQIARQKGYRFWVANPKRIKAFIESEGQRAKTDRLDAHMIARFGATHEPPRHHDTPQNEELRQLVIRRSQVKDMIGDEQRRLNHPQVKVCADAIKRHILFIKQELTDVKHQIRDEINRSELLSEKADLMTSMPGIGQATAATLLALMPELGKVGNRQIAALVGVAPYTCESGLFKGRSRIAGGRGMVRKVLYMCGMTCLRSNKKFQVFYQRLIKEGKNGKVALIAVIRKMIVTLNAMLREGEQWRCLASCC